MLSRVHGGIPEEVSFPVDWDDLVCDVDMSLIKKLIPISFGQILGERQTVVRLLRDVLENTESPTSMTKTVGVNVISPLLVDIPGEVGKGSSSED